MVFLRFIILWAFIIIFVSEPVCAEGILDQIGWRDPSRKDPGLVMLLGIIIVFIFSMAYRAWFDMREKIEKRKIRLEKEELSRKEFVRRSMVKERVCHKRESVHA